MIYLSLEQVVELNSHLLEEFDGISEIKELTTLVSTIVAPVMAVFGHEIHNTVFDKAAAYLYQIARNQPFLEGNCLTAAAAALLFLRTNGKSPHYSLNDFTDFVLKVADGKIDLPTISKYLKKICS